MSNVQFTNLPAAIAITDSDIIAIVQSNISKRATIQQIKDTLNSGTVTSVTGEGDVNGITLTGEVTSSGALTLGGSLSNIDLQTQVTGVLPANRGGTGSSMLTGLIVGNGESAFSTVLAPSGDVVGTTDEQTLYSKNIVPRVYTIDDQNSPWLWSSSNFDMLASLSLAGDLIISADYGSPTDGQKVTFRIKDNGTARTLTWTTGSTNSFRAIGVTLPTTTVANKTVYVGCLYNSADSRWDVVAVAQEA